MTINWKKIGLYGGGGVVLVVIAYFLYKFESNQAAQNAQATADENAQDNEIASSFMPQVGLGSQSPSINAAEQPQTVSPTSSAVDPSILAVIQAITGNGAASPGNNGNPAPSSGTTVPVSSVPASPVGPAKPPITSGTPPALGSNGTITTSGSGLPIAKTALSSMIQ